MKAKVVRRFLQALGVVAALCILAMFLKGRGGNSQPTAPVQPVAQANSAPVTTAPPAILSTPTTSAPAAPAISVGEAAELAKKLVERKSAPSPKPEAKPKADTPGKADAEERKLQLEDCIEEYKEKAQNARANVNNLKGMVASEVPVAASSKSWFRANLKSWEEKLAKYEKVMAETKTELSRVSANR